MLLNCDVGEDSWESLGQQGNQTWIFFGRTDAEAETAICWPPYVKSQLTGKDPDAGKGWRQKEKGTIEDEMVGWHHRLNGHEFEKTPGDGKPGVLQFMGSQRIGHNWVSEQQQCQTEATDPGVKSTPSRINVWWWRGEYEEARHLQTIETQKIKSWERLGEKHLPTEEQR